MGRRGLRCERGQGHNFHFLWRRSTVRRLALAGLGALCGGGVPNGFHPPHGAGFCFCRRGGADGAGMAFEKGGRAVLLIRILHGAMYERRPGINREPIRRGDRRITRERGDTPQRASADETPQHAVADETPQQTSADETPLRATDKGRPDRWRQVATWSLASIALFAVWMLGILSLDWLGR
jgi:hypothetical protein